MSRKSRTKWLIQHIVAEQFRSFLLQTAEGLQKFRPNLRSFLLPSHIYLYSYVQFALLTLDLSHLQTAAEPMEVVNYQF